MEDEQLTEPEQLIQWILNGGKRASEATDWMCDCAYAELMAMGADVKHPGFPALLTVAAGACARALKGQDYRLLELTREYADSRRITWAAAWVDMGLCLQRAGVAVALRELVDKVTERNSKNLGIYEHGDDSL